MKFTQIAVGKWGIKDRRGYTLFALDDQGRVFKSMVKFDGKQHKGWMELTNVEFNDVELNHKATEEVTRALAAGEVEVETESVPV